MPRLLLYLMLAALIFGAGLGVGWSRAAGVRDRLVATADSVRAEVLAAHADARVAWEADSIIRQQAIDSLAQALAVADYSLGQARGQVHRLSAAGKTAIAALPDSLAGPIAQLVTALEAETMACETSRALCAERADSLTAQLQAQARMLMGAERTVDQLGIQLGVATSAYRQLQREKRFGLVRALAIAGSCAAGAWGVAADEVLVGSLALGGCGVLLVF